MRVANVAGRLAVESNSRWVDVALASGGRFAPDPQAVYDRWDDFVSWVSQGSPPMPRPRPVRSAPPSRHRVN